MNTMKKYIVHDVLEAFIIDKETDESYFFGWTTEGNVSRTINQEPIRAGIYNKVVGVIQTDEGMEFSVTTGVHYQEAMELQMNSKFESVTDLTVMEVSQGVDGSFTATEKTVSGEVMDLKAKNLPKNYKVQLRSIAYDPDSNEEVADIYWIFEKARPNGSLEESFVAGSNKIQTIDFTAMVAGDSYGQYAIVPKIQDNGGKDGTEGDI